tara:strand:+ start:624 stop:1238 length:615 start_codon:yes stop_codon:yes gene_type:complete
MSAVCAMRDFLIFSLSVTSLHQILNVMSEPDCAADDSYLCSHASRCPLLIGPMSAFFLFVVVVSSASSLSAFGNGWSNCNRWTWGVDALGVIPGVYWQIVTRPVQWSGAASTCVVDDFASATRNAMCTVEGSPLAFALFLLSEWLVYGTLLRLVISAGFGRAFLPTAIIISLAFVIVFGQMLVSGWMRAGLADAENWVCSAPLP